jgi:hypothetical protein
MPALIEYRFGDVVTYSRLLENGELHHAFTQDENLNLENSLIIGCHLSGLLATINMCDEVGCVVDPNDEGVVADLAIDSFEIDTVLRGEERSFVFRDRVLGPFTVHIAQLVGEPSML